MMTTSRRIFLGVGLATVSILIAGAGSAAAFDWNGTWSGAGSNGRKTEISIAGNKVQSWRSNGEGQSISKSSVGKDGVSITHAGGAKVTLRPRNDGKVNYSWRGQAGSSTAVLARK